MKAELSCFRGLPRCFISLLLLLTPRLVLSQSPFSEYADRNLTISADRTLRAISDGGGITANVDLYQRVEEVMTNDIPFANPFTETELRLNVTAPPGRGLGSSFTWYGFYDGDGAGGQTGKIWKFRLLFDYPGTWTVHAGFFVPGANTPNGSSQIYTYNVSANRVAGEHGHIRVDPQNFRRLRHDDGTPWVPFVMQGSMLLDRDQALSKQWIDQHVALGVDALAVRFHAESYLLGEPHRAHFIKNGDAWDYARYDLSTWHYNEQIIEYAQSKDVKLCIWFGMSGLNPQYDSYGPRDYPNNTSLGPQQKAFIKYFLARWAPYTNFWHWTVDSEYEETGAGALERNRAYAAELRAKNPWRTLVTTHVLSNWSPGNSPEFDLATLQRRVADTDAGATDCLSFITSNDDYGIPVFNSEGIWALSTATRSRVAMWTHLMAGGFGMIAHFATDGTHRTSSWGVTWDSVNPRHQEDAVEMGKLAQFFNHTPGIDINLSAPQNELVRIRGGHLALCLAQSGENYYLWLDQGGAPSLDLTGISGNFSVTRYRCTALTHPDTLASISGGGMRTLEATPTTGFDNDYLYVVKHLIIVNTIDIIAPNGGENWNAATMAAVSWAASGAIANVNIDLSGDGGLTYPFVLAAGTPNDGNEVIKVPSIITAQARIRVSAASDNAIYDFSDANFTITDAPDWAPPVVTITSPAGDGQSFKGNVAAAGIATDDAGVAKVAWQLDGITGPWHLASGSNKWNFLIPQPGDGCHTVYVCATDIAAPANTSVPVARHFVADNTGPCLSDIRMIDLAQTTATIAWNTDEAADSRVQWGTAPNNYTGDTGIVETGVTRHVVTLNNLAAGTTYHFIAMSSDTVGNLSPSTDFTFTTLSIIFADDFNTGAIEVDKWMKGTNSGNQAAVVNNMLELRSSVAASSWIITKDNYAARNTMIKVKVVQPHEGGDLGMGPTYNLASPDGLDDQSNFYRFHTYREGAGGLYRLFVQWKKNGVAHEVDVTGGMVISGAVYLRLRFDSTNVHFEASLDGAGWTDTYTEAFGLPGYTLDSRFYYELAGHKTNSTGVLTVDDFFITNGGANSFAAQPAAEKSTTAIPATLAVVQNYPNPFSVSGTTRIRLRLSQDAEIQLSVLALSGREVQQLAAGSFCTGNHEVIWDGRDREGGALSSGIYFLRLRYRTEVSNGWSQIAQRVLLVK